MYAPPKPRREEFVKYWLLGLSTKKLDTYSTKYKVWSIFNIDYLALVKMDGVTMWRWEWEEWVMKGHVSSNPHPD